MKYLTKKMAAIIIVMMLSLGGYAQEGMRIGFKSIKEIFKESDCNYCSKAYSFVQSVNQIKSDIQKLSSVKQKKRTKLTKRLGKRLETFAKNSDEEWIGLSIELQTSDKSSEANRQVIKLKLHLEDILSLDSTDMEANEQVQQSLKSILELQKQITKTLKH